MSKSEKQTGTEQNKTYAETFENIARELELSRQQCQRPHHLLTNLDKAIGHAAKLTAEFIKKGRFNFLVPKVDVFKLDALNTFYKAGEKNSGKENEVLYFEMAIIPALRKMYPVQLKKDCGSFGWTQIKKDKGGNPVYEKGKLIKVTRYGDQIDSLDDAARLECYRAQAQDYADVCRLLGSLLKEKSSQPAKGATAEKWYQSRTLQATFIIALVTIAGWFLIPYIAKIVERSVNQTKQAPVKDIQRLQVEQEGKVNEPNKSEIKKIETAITPDANG